MPKKRTIPIAYSIKFQLRAHSYIETENSGFPNSITLEREGVEFPISDFIHRVKDYLHRISWFAIWGCARCQNVTLRGMYVWKLLCPDDLTLRCLDVRAIFKGDASVASPAAPQPERARNPRIFEKYLSFSLPLLSSRSNFEFLELLQGFAVGNYGVWTVMDS